MKKKSLLALALCLLLALSACGRMSNEELQASMPKMAVISGSQQVSASSGGGDWTYQKNSLAIDAVHPLQSEEAMTALSADSSVSAAAGTEVGMYFSVQPDSVTITYLPTDTAADSSVPEGETAEVSYGNDVFSFIMPDVSQDVVVTATAVWNSRSDQSGTLNYHFIVTQG